MRAYQPMRDGFGLDERIRGHPAVELVRRMNSKSPRLVRHERVVRHEEEIACQKLPGFANADKPTALVRAMLSATPDSVVLSWVYIGAPSREK
jgi:hypothetical protein